MPGAPPPPPAPAPLFDSHAHLTDPQFAADLPLVLRRARAANVTEVLMPASEPADADRAADIARAAASADAEGASQVGAGSAGASPRLFWSVGVHPHAAGSWDASMLSRLEERLAAGAIAVGETGLDFHYDNAPREKQREAFEAQARLARECDLPLVVHAREADRETVEILRGSGIEPRRVILHCFSSGPELLEAALEAGWYVSFSGLITFRSYATPEFLRAVPPERLLVETDAPYLAPVPLRGRRNEPAFLPATLARLAAARGMEPAEAAALTRVNASRVYKLTGPP